jgi:2-polyprenyl-3-methyl-5-hydroxy-6-metoxy-1,4-benzoquinol methylase
MPNPSCLVCSSKRSDHCLNLQTPAGKITYFRCPECSLIFQAPGISFKEEDIYNADYIQKRSQNPDNLDTARSRKKTAEHYYHWVEKFVNKGNLLEVGCATGLALKVAQDHGWKVFGVEVNEKAASLAKDVLKEDVIKVGNLNNDMFPDEYFSLITLFDVIEHIPHPVEFLSILHKKTAPGGSILFVTPNIDTLSFKILKEKWPHFVQEHLALFSPQSMDRLLKETGFMPKAHGWATKYISIKMLRTHSEHHPNAFFYKPISWILGKIPFMGQTIFPFNLGEMFVLAEKI